MSEEHLRLSLTAAYGILVVAALLLTLVVKVLRLSVRFSASSSSYVARTLELIGGGGGSNSGCVDGGCGRDGKKNSVRSFWQIVYAGKARQIAHMIPLGIDGPIRTLKPTSAGFADRDHGVCAANKCDMAGR